MPQLSIEVQATDLIAAGNCCFKKHVCKEWGNAYGTYVPQQFC